MDIGYLEDIVAGLDDPVVILRHDAAPILATASPAGIDTRLSALIEHEDATVHSVVVGHFCQHEAAIR